jgi:hypothetical protein
MRLHTIPDTVDEFTGYALTFDMIAWDFAGVTSTYRPNGLARVRNVVVPSAAHITLPAAAYPLALDPAMRQWINDYTPGRVNGFPAVAQSTDGALWAADVWYSIKKHWVLEAQKVVLSKRGLGPTQ